MKNIAFLGIRDITNPKDGASIRNANLFHTLNRYHKCEYYNLGNSEEWSKLSLIGKLNYAPNFALFWKDQFSLFHYDYERFLNVSEKIRKQNPDVIILSEIWMKEYYYAIKAFYPDAEIIFDLHNVDSEIQKTIAKEKPFPFNLAFWMHAKDLERAERNISKKISTILIPSQQDAGLFKQKYGAIPTVVPNLISPKPMQPLTTRQTIGYVGIYNYQPNEEAANYIINKLNPLLDVPTYLIGKNPTKSMQSHDLDNSNIIVTGEVEDLDTVLADVRTMVMPITKGSGTRLKALEAMMKGIPIVATPKAVEGLGLTPHVHYLPADSPGRFRYQIKKLWFFPDIENRLRKQARQFVMENYSTASYQPEWI